MFIEKDQRIINEIKMNSKFRVMERLSNSFYRKFRCGIVNAKVYRRWSQIFFCHRGHFQKIWGNEIDDTKLVKPGVARGVKVERTDTSPMMRSG